MRSFSRSVLLAGAALLAARAAHAQPALDIPGLVRRAGPAVVSIQVFDGGGRQISLGSGFFLADGRVVTNAHVVEGGARAEIFSVEGRSLGSVRHAEAISGDVDIAVLPRVTRPPATLTLAAGLPSVGESVIAIGAPEGLTNTVSNGIVSAIRQMEGMRLVQITAPISSGSSGGPVLNARGEVVGVSVAVLDEGQNLNFAIPASDVRTVAAGRARQVPFPRGEGAGRVVSGEEDTVDPDVFRGPGVRTFTGRLERGDARLEDGSFYDTYVFRGQRGQRVTIGMRSDDFDSYLTVGSLSGGRFVALVSDDDGGDRYNSALEVVLPATGEYAIRANSVEGGETGAYQLLVVGAEGARAAAEAPPEEPGVRGNTPEIPRLPDAGGRNPRQGGSDARWVFAAESPRYTDHFDRTRIARAPGQGTWFVWVRSTYHEVERTSDGARYDSDISRKEIDCTRRRSRVHEWVLYYQGRVAHEYPPEPTDWDGWERGTIGESSNAAICNWIRGNM